MSSERRTGKTNKATSAGLEWLRCCPLKRVRRVRTTMCCGPVSSLPVTELAVSWYKGQQGSRSVCGSAFPRVQLSCGTAALFSGSPFYGCHGSCGYNVTVILPLTPSWQTRCTVPRWLSIWMATQISVFTNYPSHRVSTKTIQLIHQTILDSPRVIL